MWDKISNIIAWTVITVMVLSVFGALFWVIGKLILLMLGINFNWTFQHGVLTYIGFVILKQIITCIENIFIGNNDNEDVKNKEEDK